MFDKRRSMLEPIWLDETEQSRWPSQRDSVGVGEDAQCCLDGIDGTYYETCLRLKLDPEARKNITRLQQDIHQVGVRIT
jgi:hypothetical protein